MTIGNLMGAEAPQARSAHSEAKLGRLRSALGELGFADVCELVFRDRSSLRLLGGQMTARLPGPLIAGIFAMATETSNALLRTQETKAT